jgi:hypothetical protein
VLKLSDQHPLSGLGAGQAGDVKECHDHAFGLPVAISVGSQPHKILRRAIVSFDPPFKWAVASKHLGNVRGKVNQTEPA